MPDVVGIAAIVGGALILGETEWAMTELGPYMMQTLYHGLDTPVSFKPEDRSKAAAAYAISQLDRLLDALETRLEKRDYLMGEFSLDGRKLVPVLHYDGTPITARYISADLTVKLGQLKVVSFEKAAS